MQLLGVVLEVALAVLAWWIARARRAHRPVAVVVSAALAADLVHWALAALVLAPARVALGVAPYAGWSRLAFHAQQACFLAWPALLAGLGAVVFLDERAARRGVRAIAVIYGAAVLVLAIAYPSVRGLALARAYVGAELAGLFAVVGAGVVWWRRREAATLTEGTVMTLGAFHVGAVVAARAPWGAGWDFAVIVLAFTYGALILVHLSELQPWARR